MALSDIGYSSVIAWLKIILPLIALGLLSTVFLLSREADPTSAIPFSDTGIEDRASRQEITSPYFTGTTRDGATLTISAKTARPDIENDGTAYAEGISAHMVMTSGAELDLVAENAQVSDLENTLDLVGSVKIDSSTGYHLVTQKLTTSLSEVSGETDGEVSGDGPVGRFTAGKMQIRTDPETGDVHLVFTDGIKLIYEPQN